MKKAAYGLVAAFLASGVYGGIPSSAEGWYTPEKGFSRQAGSGTVYYLDDATGEEKSVSVSVDNFGNVSGGMSSIGDPSLKTAYDALVKACQNQAYNALQDEAIETIGKNLYELTSKTGIEITNPETGRKFTIKFSSGTMAQTVGQSTGNIPATSDAEDPADLKTLNWTEDSESSKLQLYGANTATSSTDYWWSDYGFFVPFLKGSGALGWKRYEGWDSSVFSAGDDMATGHVNDGNLHLRGWYANSPSCDTNFQTILTNDNSVTDRQEHWILSRYKHGSADPVLHWIRFDAEAMKVGGDSAQVDDMSIETNDVGQVGVFGFEEAMASLEGESDGALVPYVDSASTKLQWGGMEQFFSDTVFRKSATTGKMLLNGTSEEGKVKVLTMTGTGEDDQHVNALTFDARSVDGVNGIVQVHGFDVAASPFESGVNFTDALTNMSVSIANMSVLLRVPVTNGSGYEVKYAPLAKITGIPAAPVDDITIELNKTDPLNPYLQLHGAAGDGITLEEGDVYMIGSDGKGKFGKQCAADGDDSEVSASGENSLESYTNSEGERFFRIKGWDVNREGTPHLLGWEANEMRYFEADGSGGVETKTTSAGDSVQLAGHDSAGEGAIPYAKKDGNGLGWLAGVDDRVPLLHASSAPTTMALGGSLDKANVSAVPTLNVSGFTSGGNCTTSLNKMLSDPDEGSNRSAHQFMARYSSGGGTPTVHWVGIDGLIGGGGSPVDDTSITTNTSHGASSDGVASIFGFSTASAGDIPHKTDDGKIEWKPVANGGALIVSGTSGSTVTTATCTNKLSFVSASDSNVKFTVTDEGNGNVKVTVGVYWK